MNMKSRKSIRLKGYDYSKEGFYFVTISTYKNQYLFGKIINGEMILNTFGEIVKKLWMKSEEIRDNVKMHDFVVMPNHFHGVIEIIPKKDSIGMNAEDSPKMNAGAYRICPENEGGGEDYEMGLCNRPVRLMSPKNTVGAIIRGFKGSVTKEVRLLCGNSSKKVWHRNYHEHIVRNEYDYKRISKYIRNNVKKWCKKHPK
jgi:REP element-mobilizing transposase RayT